MSNNIVKLLTAICGSVQTAEDMFQQLLSERSIDTATGDQLDVIGRIVGQSRGGQDDDTYRRYCRARVAVNFSKGIVEDLIRVATLAVYEDGAVYAIEQAGTATVVVWIANVATPDDVGTVTSAMLQQAKSGGVRLITAYSTHTPAQTFTLDVGPGLDVGHLAMGI